MNSLIRTLPNIFRCNVERYQPMTIGKFLHTTSPFDAGHSKWANIRHIKALKDGQKSAMFTRLARQLRLAIQDGGSADPALNSNLRGVIELALRKNMPMSTIQSTIKKSGENKLQLKKHILEMRALNKIFCVCILYTDNFAGLKMNLATIVRKGGAVFIDAHHLFDDFGVIEAIASDEIKTKCKTADDLEEITTEDAIECGAEEIEVIGLDTGSVNFICNPIELQRISSALTVKGYKIEAAEHVFMPKAYVSITEAESDAFEKLRQKLKAIEGFEEIYDNIQPSEA